MSWQDDLAQAPADAQQAAEWFAAQTIPSPTVSVRGSLVTLADLLTDTEYNVLRAVFAAAASAEKTAGGFLINDMLDEMQYPVADSRQSGGLDFSRARVQEKVAMMCAESPALAAVPGKLLAWVAAAQPAPLAKYPPPLPHAGDILAARGQTP